MQVEVNTIPPAPVKPKVDSYVLTVTPEEAAIIYVAIGALSPVTAEGRGLRPALLRKIYDQFAEIDTELFHYKKNYRGLFG